MRPYLFLAVALFGCSAVAGPNVIGDVDSDSLAELTEKIEATPDGASLSLYFNSPGGSVAAGLDFIRAMEQAQARGVRFVCTADLAASMGAVIFSACDTRLALPRALFLIHNVSVGMAGGNSQALRQLAKRLEVVTDASILRQIGRVVNLPFAELKRRAAAEYWFDSAEAIRIGLVQRVL